MIPAAPFLPACLGLIRFDDGEHDDVSESTLWQVA